MSKRKGRKKPGQGESALLRSHSAPGKLSLPEKRWLGLLGWLAVTAVAAAIGSRFMPGAWYTTLAKPSWTPPGWLFAPVWTVLYLTMAIAAWLVWCRGGFHRSGAALGLYLLQLTLNTAWSWLFFGHQRPDLALADILALLAAITATTILFWRRRRGAGLLFLPYLLWVAFAATLNFEIWRMNG